MTRFFSFKTLTAVGNMIKIDGVALLVNVFAGVMLSATWAVAAQIRLALQAVASSFQQACLPTIYKGMAAGDVRGVARFLRWDILFALVLLGVPIMVWFACSGWLLPMWLGADCPVGLQALVVWSMFLAVIDVLAQPLTVTVMATGRIALFQVVLLLFAGVGFGGVWLVLVEGSPIWGAMAALVAANTLALVYRVMHIRQTGILREKRNEGEVDDEVTLCV